MYILRQKVMIELRRFLKVLASHRKHAIRYMVLGTLGLILIWLGYFLLWINGRSDYENVDPVPHYPLQMPVHHFSTLVEQERRQNQTWKGISPINLAYHKIKINQYISPDCNEASRDNPLDLVLLVRTTVTHTKERSILRQTWVNQTFLRTFSPIRVKVAFIIGIEEHPGNKANNVISYPKSVQEEIKLHQDFIVGDFRDTYLNLTFKSMTGIRWAQETCLHFKFLLLTDDDMYISVTNLLRFLQDPFKYPHNDLNLDLKDDAQKSLIPDVGNFYAGELLGEGLSSPYRVVSSKFYISREDYPFSRFPRYVSGGGIILSRRTVEEFYFGSLFVKHLFLEDVYLGLVGSKLGIVPFNATAFINCCNYRGEESDCATALIKISFSTAIAIHNVVPMNERIQFWKRMRSDKVA